MSKKIVTIAANAVNAKLHEASREVKLEVQRVLSYKVEGAEHSLLYKQHRWDGRSSLLDFRSGIFPAGFIHFVSANLKKAGYEVRIVKKPLPTPLGPENPIVDSFPEDPRYDYQPEVVRRLVKHGQIIAQVATGGGKSRIARLAFARINRPTLFLTTRSILMYQMKDAFENDLNVDVSVLGDGQFGTTEGDIKRMSVGMVQTLSARLEETTVEREYEKLYASAEKVHDGQSEAMRKVLRASKTPEKTIDAEIKKLDDAFDARMKANAEKMGAIAKKKYEIQCARRARTIALLEKFEFIILEEAHEASGNSYYEIMRHCKNAHYRLALTATPFMKENEEANMRLMAVSGPIAIKITEKMLIDRGILAKPYFKIVELKNKPANLRGTTPWQSAYRIGVVENAERNLHIAEYARQAARYGMSIMILVQHKKHGDELLTLLVEKGIRSKFIQGEDNHSERKAALKLLAEGEITALIGTTILDVGVDVPAVGMIILAGGGKAEVALRQRIGRGLRAKKRGPNVALIVDFNDPFNSHLRDHAAQRLAIIKGTEGFGENIISGDFDYVGLGLDKLAA